MSANEWMEKTYAFVGYSRWVLGDDGLFVQLDGLFMPHRLGLHWQRICREFPRGGMLMGVCSGWVTSEFDPRWTHHNFKKKKKKPHLWVYNRARSPDTPPWCGVWWWGCSHRHEALCGQCTAPPCSGDPGRRSLCTGGDNALVRHFQCCATFASGSSSQRKLSLKGRKDNKAHKER